MNSQYEGSCNLMIFKLSTCDFLEQATEDRLEEQIQFTDKETETSPFDSGEPL